MSISNFFKNTLKAPLVNTRWSWGAIRPGSSDIFLRVWADQIDHTTSPPRILIRDPHWNENHAGYKERQRHIDELRNGATGYGLVCTAKDTDATAVRSIASYDDKDLLTLGKLWEENGRIYAAITGSVPVSGVPTGNSSVVSDIQAVLTSPIEETTKEILAQARIGQGKFRSDVLSRWGYRCCVTGSRTLDAVRASHIKPWSDCSNSERLDPHNGLPLVATLDALFDAGLISFRDDGEVLISESLANGERITLGLLGLRLSQSISSQTKVYLAHHRKSVFRGQRDAA